MTAAYKCCKSINLAPVELDTSSVLVLHSSQNQTGSHTLLLHPPKSLHKVGLCQNSRTCHYRSSCHLAKSLHTNFHLLGHKLRSQILRSSILPSNSNTCEAKCSYQIGCSHVRGSYPSSTLPGKYLHSHNTFFPSHSDGPHSTPLHKLQSYRSKSHTPKEIKKKRMQNISQSVHTSVIVCMYDSISNTYMFLSIFPFTTVLLHILL